MVSRSCWGGPDLIGGVGGSVFQVQVRTQHATTCIKRFGATHLVGWWPLAVDCVPLDWQTGLAPRVRCCCCCQAQSTLAISSDREVFLGALACHRRELLITAEQSDNES